MAALMPSCSECEYDHATYDYELEDYFCAKCRMRATHDERVPRPPSTFTAADDPWLHYDGDLPEALR